MSMMLRRRLLALSRAVWATISGAVATFTTLRAAPLKSLVADIVPLQSGSGDPTPSNIRPITGATAVNISMGGKNLLNESARVTGWSINASGALVQRSAGSYTQLMKVNPGSKYVFSAKSGTSSSQTRLIHGYDSSGTWLQQVGYYTGAVAVGSTYSKAVTIPNTVTHVRVSYESADNTGQFEAGEIATAFEAYSVSVIPISISTPPGTVFGGTLDMVSGELAVTWVSVEYDGSNDESWVCNSNMRYTIKPDVAPHYVRTSDKFIIGSTTKPISAGGIGSTNEDRCCVYSASTIGILKASIQNDVAAFRTFLSNNPAQLVYQAKTPLVYQLTPQQINALLGVNNIWVNTGDVSVTYQSN